MSKIGIVGGPRTGKTTLARKLGGTVHHLDSFMQLGWSEASEAAAQQIDKISDPAVLEGVSLARALRKWLRSHPEGKPLDKVIVLQKPMAEVSAGQVVMGMGVGTVFNEISEELIKRGTEIVYAQVT